MHFQALLIGAGVCPISVCSSVDVCAGHAAYTLPENLPIKQMTVGVTICLYGARKVLLADEMAVTDRQYRSTASTRRIETGS